MTTDDLMEMPPPGIDAQIKCVEREVAMRERVYPRWVASGKMKSQVAAYELLAMQTVLQTLKGINDA